jgi:hypothetical protein
VRSESIGPAAPARARNLPLIVAAAVALAALLAGGLALVARRERAAAAGPAIATVDAPSAEQLARRIADLDARFDATSAPDERARAEYDAERAALKRALAALLARRNVPV